jgi:hypothetical protein
VNGEGFRVQEPMSREPARRVSSRFGGAKNLGVLGGRYGLSWVGLERFRLVRAVDIKGHGRRATCDSFLREVCHVGI